MVLVVAMDPQQFRAAYNVPAGVQVFGPYELNLDNAGEHLELSKPSISQDEPGGTLVYVPVDHVSYGSSSPWPSTPDGGGASLSRTGTGYGNDPASWSASTQVGGTPGRPNVATGNVAGDLAVGGRNRLRSAAPLPLAGPSPTPTPARRGRPRSTTATAAARRC